MTDEECRSDTLLISRRARRVVREFLIRARGRRPPTAPQLAGTATSPSSADDARDGLLGTTRTV